MKPKSRLLAFFMLALFPWSFALGATPAQEAFARLKALKGEWRDVSDKNNAHTVTYEVRSDGHTVVETMWDMVTVFHLDGESILMTHYCSAGNQPRTRASDFSDAATLEFKFVDVTNGKEGGHYINGLKMELLSADKIRNSWTSAGHEGQATVVELERVKK